MTFDRWVLGALTAGLILGAGAAQANPYRYAPADEVVVESVQFFFDEPPVYYDPPPPVYYRAPPRREYYPPPRREYYPAPPPPVVYYGPPRGRVAPPPPRYARPVPAPRRAGPPAYYTKDQVRAWNRSNGF